ncbi:MAG: hypothetical protein ABH851_09305 [Methanobacteriota archaeon]
MLAVEQTTLVLLLILMPGLLIPDLFRRFKPPFTVSTIQSSSTRKSFSEIQCEKKMLTSY